MSGPEAIPSNFSWKCIGAAMTAGLHKAGGIPVPDSILQDCVETTRLRYQTLAGLLAQELKSNAA